MVQCQQDYDDTDGWPKTIWAKRSESNVEPPVEMSFVCNCRCPL